MAGRVRHAAHGSLCLAVLVVLVVTLVSLLVPPREAMAHQESDTESKSADIKGGDDKGIDIWGVNIKGYVENSYTWNLQNRKGPNQFRLFDEDAGYTFDGMMLSLSREATEASPLGFELAIGAGKDASRSHSLGLFRSSGGEASSRHSLPFDIHEAYLSARIPVGNGLTLMVGKVDTLVGYESHASFENLNFSHSLMFTLGVPDSATGALATYQVSNSLALTFGVVTGWEKMAGYDSSIAATGRVSFKPDDNLSIAFNWIAGKEANGGSDTAQWLADWVVVYTGIDRVTLGLNADIGGASRAPDLVAAGKSNASALWGGIAGYAAYDWTKSFRTAVRAEYFLDGSGIRNGVTEPGKRLDLFEVTLTAEYKFTEALVGRLEFRHDQAGDRAFGAGGSKSQDTLSFSLYYRFR